MSLSRLGAPQGLDDLLLYRLSRLLGVAGAPVIRLCEGQFGITRREWRVLALLARDDGLLSSQVAERAQLDRARTSKAITSLVAKKLLRREARPGDRRQAALALTEAGRALYTALFPLVLQINRDLLACLADAEVDGFDAALDALQRRADMLAAQSTLPKADRRRGSGVLHQRMG
ncbi:MAG: MarR family transcriptional regulator [Haliea sp.]|nr:MAG: MarR family transcriptional regulator [Haliea sp.]